MHTNYSLHGDDIIPYYSIQEWIDNWDELFNRVEVERETIGVYDNNNYCLFVPFTQAAQDWETDSQRKTQHQTKRISLYLK